MRILTNDEQIARATAYRNILAARCAIADERVLTLEAKAVYKIAAARKAQDAAVCATNRARRLERDLEQAEMALEVLLA